jgi:hypothetical protein
MTEETKMNTESVVFEPVKNAPIQKEDTNRCELCEIYTTPNETTIAAMEELNHGGLQRFSSVTELLADLNSDIE